MPLQGRYGNVSTHAEDLVGKRAEAFDDFLRRTAAEADGHRLGRRPRGTRATGEKNVTNFEVKAIGRVASPLTNLKSPPRQADEGAPEAWLVFEPEMLEGLRNLRSGG